MADKYTPERATSGKERLRTWWKKVENNFVKIFGAVNKHIDGTADRHTADMVDYSDTKTVKAKLDSTDTKLDTKVDKVEGKSLVDKAFANDVSTRKAALGNGNIATIDSQLETYSITTRLEAEVAISGMDDSGNTEIKKKSPEKANTHDLVNKVEKVNGKSLVDKSITELPPART